MKAKIPQKSSSTADSVNPFLGLIFGNPPAPATSTTLIDSVLNPILSKEDVGNSLSPSQPVIEGTYVVP